MTFTTTTVNNRAQAHQWRSYAIMLFASLGVVSCAWLVGCTFNAYYPLPKLAANFLDLMGYILWGTGLARPRINHLTDCSHTKMLNRRLQIICAQVGIFAFVLATSLVTET